MGVITLGRMSRTYLVSAVALGVLVSATLFILVYPATFYSFTCSQFELPELGKTYGFTFSELEVSRPDGSVEKARGISAVDPNGAFARSGIRAGDIPRTHHGLVDFCNDISIAAETGTHRSAYSTLSIRRQGRSPGVRLSFGCVSGPITVPSNNAMHQTRRGGAVASRPVVEARLAGDCECCTGVWCGARG